MLGWLYYCAAMSEHHASNRWQTYADLALAGERLTREQAGHVLAHEQSIALTTSLRLD